MHVFDQEFLLIVQRKQPDITRRQRIEIEVIEAGRRTYHVAQTVRTGDHIGCEPVAMAFLSAPPAGVRKMARAEAASCGYWRHASEGHSFYTTPDDHQNCPIGAFTHGVTPAAGKAQALESVIGMMVELKYLRAEEVPAIPHRTESAQIVAYAPLAEMTFDPDVVIFRGTPRQIMLLSEAARAAGIFDGSTMGRPAIHKAACGAITITMDGPTFS